MNQFKLTYETFKKFVDDLVAKSEPKPMNWVMVTGYQGMVNFSLAAQNMYMPSSVPYTYVNYKRLPHIYYLSIGSKESRLKVVLNTKTREYEIYWFTNKIFRTGNIPTLNMKIREIYEANKHII